MSWTTDSAEWLQEHERKRRAAGLLTATQLARRYTEAYLDILQAVWFEVDAQAAADRRVIGRWMAQQAAFHREPTRRCL